MRRTLLGLLLLAGCPESPSDGDGPPPEDQAAPDLTEEDGGLPAPDLRPGDLRGVDLTGVDLAEPDLAPGPDLAPVSDMPSPPGVIFSRTFGASAWAQGQRVVADGTGAVIVGGYFSGKADFGGGVVDTGGGFNGFLARYDGAGAHKWSKRLASMGDARVYDVAVNGDGDLAIAGRFTGTVDLGAGPLTEAGAGDIFVARYRADGAHAWAKRLGGPLAESGQAVAFAPGGDLILVGSANGAIDLGGGALPSGAALVVARYRADGSHVWSKRLGSALGSIVQSAATDGMGNVVLGGWTFPMADLGGGVLTCPGDQVGFVVKLGADGGHLWSRCFGVMGRSNNWVNGVAADSGGNVVIGGTAVSDLDFGGGVRAAVGPADAFVAKYSAAGAHLWSKRFGVSGGDTRAWDLAVGPGYEIALGGDFEGGVDFGGGPLMGGFIGDVFAVRLSGAGGHLQSRRFGGDGLDIALGVAFSPGGNLLVTGQFSRTVDFGAGPRTAAGSQDGFLMKLER